MITLPDARRHLRIDGEQDDYEIDLKLDQAYEIVSRYAATPDLTELTTEDPIPKGRGIDAAVLLVLGELWENRESSSADPLSPGVKNVLALFKPVVFA